MVGTAILALSDQTSQWAIFWSVLGSTASLVAVGGLIWWLVAPRIRAALQRFAVSVANVEHEVQVNKHRSAEPTLRDNVDAMHADVLKLEDDLDEHVDDALRLVDDTTRQAREQGVRLDIDPSRYLRRPRAHTRPRRRED